MRAQDHTLHSCRGRGREIVRTTPPLAGASNLAIFLPLSFVGARPSHQTCVINVSWASPLVGRPAAGNPPGSGKVTGERE